MAVSELIPRTNIECDYSGVHHRLQLSDRNWRQFDEVGERGRALAINFCILEKVLGTRRQVGSQLLYELFPALDLQRVVGKPLGTDGGRALGTHVAAAEGSGTVRRVDEHIIREREQLGMQTVIEHAR